MKTSTWSWTRGKYDPKENKLRDTNVKYREKKANAYELHPAQVSVRLLDSSWSGVTRHKGALTYMMVCSSRSSEYKLQRVVECFTNNCWTGKAETKTTKSLYNVSSSYQLKPSMHDIGGYFFLFLIKLGISIHILTFGLKYWLDWASSLMVPPFKTCYDLHSALCRYLHDTWYMNHVWFERTDSIWLTPHNW